MIITIDGPVATGKSTLSKGLARRLGFLCFDTGAMYRVLAFALVMQGTDWDDPEALALALANFEYEVVPHGDSVLYFYEGRDVTEAIRTPEITQISSMIAKFSLVRNRLVDIQRKAAEGRDVVFEGRDLGSVVFPYAQVKFYLEGRDEVRAMRRFLEWRQKFPDKEMIFKEVLEDLKKRDYADRTREHSPLKCPVDASILDTSDATTEELIEKMWEIVQEKKMRGGDFGRRYFDQRRPLT